MNVLGFIFLVWDLPYGELIIVQRQWQERKIRSIDTSLPFALGQHERRLDIFTEREPLVDITDFDSDCDNEWVQSNMQEMLRWIVEVDLGCKQSKL